VLPYYIQTELLLIVLEFRLKNEYRENGYHQVKANQWEMKAQIQDRAATLGDFLGRETRFLTVG
jgi:hypothetical protein